MSFSLTGGRTYMVLVDATSLFAGVTFRYQIIPEKPPREHIREIYEEARSRAASSRVFFDTRGRPTAKLTTAGSALLDDSISFDQQGYNGWDGTLQTILLAARSWSG